MSDVHVDDFIDRHSGDVYARFVFHIFRLPACLRLDFAPFFDQYRLFCTYQDRRYRVTGASRMGDVWLSTDHNRDAGYDCRVDLENCSDWAPNP